MNVQKRPVILELENDRLKRLNDKIRSYNWASSQVKDLN